MVRTLVCAVLGLALCVSGTQAQDKDKPVKKDKKVAKTGVAGTVKSRDTTKGTLTITVTKTKKDRTFQVTKNTKIVGPRGGVSEDGLKDDRLARGKKVTVVPGSDSKAAAEIHLSVRARATKDKKATDKKKDSKKAADK
jgi:hypothetical protein